MRGLDFETVVGLGTLAFLMVAGILVLTAKVRLAGRSNLVLGIFLVALAGLTEVIDWTARNLAIMFSYHSVAVLSLAFGFLVAGIRQNFQTDANISWPIGMSVLHVLAVEIAYFAFPAMRGWRTLVLSSAWLVAALPLLWIRVAGMKGLWRFTIFSFPIGLASIISLLRFIFALLDMRRDDFLPESQDSWLFLLLIVACIGAFTSAVILAIQTSAKTTDFPSGEGKLPISLTEKGLGPKERQYVLDTLSGLSVKEIAYQYGISESTVRNTLAKSYRKLGVTGMVGLATLAERYTIEA